MTVTDTPPAEPLVDLGAAAPNGIMAGTEVTCVSGGTIHADVSISPGNTGTGFGSCAITGVWHLADAVAEQGQLDLTSAYDELAGMPCPPANAIVADLGGTTLPTGVYCTASGIGVTGTLTLSNGGGWNNALHLGISLYRRPAHTNTVVTRTVETAAPPRADSVSAAETRRLRAVDANHRALRDSIARAGTAAPVGPSAAERATMVEMTQPQKAVMPRPHPGGPVFPLRSIRRLAWTSVPGGVAA